MTTPHDTYTSNRYNTYRMSKLTLSVDPEVVARAKKYAKRNHTSVSQMVETYLSVVSAPEKQTRRSENSNLPPITRSLLGIVKDEGLDYREEYRKHLAEKYR
jgi:hypothetical protein